MNWIVKFLDGTTIEITDAEYKFFLGTEQQLVTFSRTGRTINKATVGSILLKSDYVGEKVVDKYDRNVGILHDGIHVVKHFGQWVRPDSAYEENGKMKYEICSWDYNYYPEIAVDEIKSPAEYHQWLNEGRKTPYLLPLADRPKLRTNEGFKQIME